MALPKIDLPILTTTLPSTNKKVSYRPFTVKEEKILLMAATGEGDEIDSATQIINNCVLEDDFDIRKLPFFDFEYIFLMIRAKSVGEEVKLKYQHNENDCNGVTEVSVDLNSVKLDKPSQDGKINLSDNFGIKLRYPSITEVAEYENKNLTHVFDLVQNLVEYVYDSEKIYQKDEDFDNEELKQWIESLTKEQSDKLLDFVKTMPRVSHRFSFKCKSCKEKVDINLKGLKDFFL
jgi:hypothetical protein